MNITNQLKLYADVEENRSLRFHTTFRIGGDAKYVVYPKTVIGLLEVIRILKKEQVPYKIFGKGSNILASDDFYDGAVLCFDRYLNECFFENDGSVLALAGASIILLAHEAAKHSFTGLEFASGIPGTVGGAVFMNAGAYKSDTAAVLKEVFVLKDGKLEFMAKEELDFSYRHSKFQQETDWIIVAARFQLEQGHQQQIMDLMTSRRERRLASQPLDKPSAGSVFRNPENAQAWDLIEKIGYRGKQIGGAKVSEKHANFIVNEENAKASDVMELATQIQTKVKEEFNVELRMEVERFNWKM